MAQKPCPHCGTLLEDDDVFCGSCNAILEDDDGPAAEHARPLAPSPMDDLGDERGDRDVNGFDGLLEELTGAFAVLEAAHVLFEGADGSEDADPLTLTRLTSVLAVRARANPDVADLGPHERMVLALLDGRRSVARVERKSGLSSEDVKRAIGTLGERGLIELRGTLRPDLRGMLGDDIDETGEFQLPQADGPAVSRRAGVSLSTADLAELGLESAEGAPIAERAMPRFQGDRTVLVRAGREALGELWVTNLSKGGLFVESNTPPPVYTPVTITLETPEGSLELRGDVVHVQLPGGPGPAGVGIQLTSLDAATRERLSAYVSGLAPLGGSATGTAPAANLELALAAARSLSNGSDAGDPYAALGLTVGASEGVVGARVAELRALFEGPHPGASPPQAARCQNAVRLLRTVAERLAASRLARPPPTVAAAPPPPPKAPPAPPPQDPRRLRAQQLLESALAELRGGRRSSALTYIKMAAEVAPNDPQVRSLLAAWTGKN